MNPKTDHQTFVLRLWQVEHENQPIVLITLDDCDTKESQVFTNLAALVAFLESRGLIGEMK